MPTIIISEREALKKLAAEGNQEAERILRSKASIWAGWKLLSEHGDEEAGRKLRRSQAQQKQNRLREKRANAIVIKDESESDDVDIEQPPKAVRRKRLVQGKHNTIHDHTIDEDAPIAKSTERRQSVKKEKSAALIEISADEQPSATSTSILEIEVLKIESDDVDIEERQEAVRRTQPTQVKENPIHGLTTNEDAPAAKRFKLTPEVKQEESEDIIETSRSDELTAPTITARERTMIKLEMEKADLEKAMLALDAKKVELQLRLLGKK